MNSVDFAVLPPHFAGAVLSLEEWESVMPGYTTFYPASFRVALPFLLASIVHHRTWLQHTLDQSHPLFCSLLWTSGLMTKLVPLVHLGSMQNSATCIPPHVSLSQRLERVESGLTSMTATINSCLSTLPEALSSSVAAALSSSPPIALNWSMVDERITQMMTAILAENKQCHTVCACPNAPEDVVPDPPVPETGFRMWTWNGKIHNVPPGFAFPKCKTCDL
ncbi:hypothetical protein H310_15105 [Aphanomyces invadans]|uniref:Uncharacterized protein n=1 Tax=Aphanomyces invadans TaxID=157072 RepID=A0A024T7S5_9STRA|nr:hypothetical protein H310_15105 [Aphanomyces invadans]ETV90065.1 hypothetical protein H310_15105 [Aphanomyces invadans]|eukprot:XP_008881304.1 hypothetical protein H310_15105 [Aphanomyces invadans]